jgi:hypothetical protein
MTQVLQYPTTTRRSLAASCLPSDEEIRERHLKHIAEITKDLAPIQGEKLTYEHQQWMRRKLRSGFTKPVRDQLTELEKSKGRTPK